MKRITLVSCLALFAAAAASAGDVVAKEPDGTQKESATRAAPGDDVTGTFSQDRDEDWFAVVCEKETICSFSVTAPEKWKAWIAADLGPDSFDVSGAAPEMNDLRLAAGTTWFRISGRGEGREAAWRVAIRPGLATGADVEPNGSPASATAVAEDSLVRGRVSATDDDLDWYRFEVVGAGPRRLAIRRIPGDDGSRREFFLNIYSAPGTRDEKVLFQYACDLPQDGYTFYPVLPAGTVGLRTAFRGPHGGERYEFAILPFEGRTTPVETAEAREAVARGVEFLLQKAPKDGGESYDVATASLVLAALAEGDGREKRAEVVERDYVAWLERKMKKAEGGAWRGHDLVAPHTDVYQVAIATLGLAEAASGGNARARDLCRQCVEWLLAAQRTDRRPAAWGKADPKDSAYGGWRYQADAKDADISASGWCVVALAAADAAGIEVPGMRDALDDGLAFILRCDRKKGFGYEPRNAGFTPMRNSIGALACLLFGMESTSLPLALDSVERHLYAATQVDDSDNYPLYYAYYATRASYLRGGPSWETWRASMIRQLVPTQSKAGSWPAIRNEKQAGPRYTTAIAIMVLRLCLNEAPKYLKAEVKGF